jgi:hypothetical protein
MRMADVSKVQKFKRHQKVVAAVDLAGVPAGTAGKVYLVNGVTWIRYRVAFENGVEIGSLDGTVLVSREDWAAQQREQRRAAADVLPAT